MAALPPRLQVPLPPVFMEHPGEPRVRWSTWSAQLDNFFALTNLTLSADQQLTNQTKNAYLATLLGSEGGRILMAHPVAATASTATFATFREAVRRLFERPVNPVRADFDFRSRRQGAHESVSDYLTALRTLYSSCTPVAFEGAPAGMASAIEEHSIAMQLAIGCYDRQTQAKLLREQVVDLIAFRDIIEADEMARASSAAIHGATAAASLAYTTRSPATKEPRQQRRHKFRDQPVDGGRRCLGCGRSGHAYKSSHCPAYGKTCRQCGILHHFQSVCKKVTNAAKAVHCISLRGIRHATPPPRVTMPATVECNGKAASVHLVVDTGADISTVQERTVALLAAGQHIRPAKTAISNFDGSTISQIRGALEVTVCGANARAQAVLYVVPDDLPAVAGRDLIHALSLHISGANLQVEKTATSIATLTNSQLPAALTDPSLGTFPNFQHEITVTPQFTAHVSPCRAVPLKTREAVNQEIQAMINAGIWSPIEKAENAHGMVCVSKKDGSVRITSDLSPLNAFVMPDWHPLPLIEDILLQLRRQNVFSKIDLRKDYFHIALAEKSRHLTATITPLGLMAYNRLPMGLRDAASVFQRCVSRTLAKCSNCVAYIDDILVYGATQAEHDQALSAVLDALAANQFRLNTAKCLFGVNAVTFLGYKVDHTGIHPTSDRIVALKRAPRPTNVRQVMSFLGAVNYLAEFVPHLADLAEPLRLLTRKNEPFRWDEPQHRAFEQLKETISSSLHLAIFDPNLPTVVTVDASDVGLGAQLSQLQDGREIPVQFASHTLQDRERNFATNEKEALGCIWAIEHWEKFLLGRHFTLRTDHGSLRTLLTQHTSTRKSAKFDRWSQRLSRFDFDVQHIRGTTNVMADALSRLPQQTCEPAIDDDDPVELQATITTLQHGPISLESIRQHTDEDTVLSQVKRYIHGHWPTKQQLDTQFLPYYRVRKELSLEEMCVTRGEHRFVIPASLQQRILTAAHEGHPGIVRAKRQLRASYWWPGQDKAVEEFVRHCAACQDSAKSHKSTVIPPSSIPRPDEPWRKLAMDICGPFAVAPHHQRFVTVVIDYHSGYPEVLLSGDITSDRLVKWLTQLFARYGNPDALVTDNGRQFVSNEFCQFLRCRDIAHITSAILQSATKWACRSLEQVPEERRPNLPRPRFRTEHPGTADELPNN